MNHNGTRPPSVAGLADTAEERAERTGHPYWVVTMHGRLQIVRPHEFRPKVSSDNRILHWIEKVRYPSYWHYRRRR